MQSGHPWKARLGVGILMLVLAFIGMVLTDTRAQGGWGYWKWIVPVYALLALWLSWYVKWQQQTVRAITIGHEVLHWVGLILSIFMVSYLVHLGTISRFIAGIFQRILLSLSVFLAGIYIESTFIVVGVVLAIFALLTALLVQYIYVVVSVVVAAILIAGAWIWISHKRSKGKAQ